MQWAICRLITRKSILLWWRHKITSVNSWLIHQSDNTRDVYYKLKQNEPSKPAAKSNRFLSKVHCHCTCAIMQTPLMMFYIELQWAICRLITNTFMITSPNYCTAGHRQLTDSPIRQCMRNNIINESRMSHRSLHAAKSNMFLSVQGPLSLYMCYHARINFLSRQGWFNFFLCLFVCLLLVWQATTNSLILFLLSFFYLLENKKCSFCNTSIGSYNVNFKGTGIYWWNAITHLQSIPSNS